MNSVILTGASGFIGRHCIKHLLEAGYNVHALYREHKSTANLLKQERLSWHDVDILDQKQVTGLVNELQATYMLHLAWCIEPGKFWDSRLNLDWLQASIHLLKVFIEAGGKRFVGAGTGAEYDWSAGKLDEVRTALNPATLYGECKSRLFQAAQDHTRRTGIEFAWGRIFWLYGPGEDKRRIVPYVINALLQDEEANCSGGTQERDFMYVEDVARAFVLLLNSNVQGAINIASGEALSVKTLVETIAKLIDKEQLLRFGAAVSSQAEPALIVADTSRLQKELNFKREYSLEEGLLLSLQWWREEQGSRYRGC